MILVLNIRSISNFYQLFPKIFLPVPPNNRQEEWEGGVNAPNDRQEEREGGVNAP